MAILTFGVMQKILPRVKSAYKDKHIAGRIWVTFNDTKVKEFYDDTVWPELSLLKSAANTNHCYALYLEAWNKLQDDMDNILGKENKE